MHCANTITAQTEGWLWTKPKRTRDYLAKYSALQENFLDALILCYCFMQRDICLDLLAFQFWYCGHINNSTGFTESVCRLETAQLSCCFFVKLSWPNIVGKYSIINYVLLPVSLSYIYMVIVLYPWELPLKTERRSVLMIQSWWYIRLQIQALDFDGVEVILERIINKNCSQTLDVYHFSDVLFKLSLNVLIRNRKVIRGWRKHKKNSCKPKCPKKILTSSCR